MIDMLNNNFDLEDHFTRLIRINKDDYILDRYACYLIAKHSNAHSKDLIDAEAYFAIKIWRDYKKHNAEGSIAI
ncbi:hypothetical protein FACS1894166_04940 [Bacilli bacterium]|nr:hypothetical protein FACS1894166_04940 [Bacilli bacterium]